MKTLHPTESTSILTHVYELRNKLLIALVAFVIGATIAHIFHEKLIAFLLKPVGSQPLIFLSPLEPLFFIFKIDCIVGIIIAFPIIIWCLFSYIAPALSERASSYVAFFYIASTLLLFSGLGYALYFTIPLSLKVLFSISIPGIANSFSVQSYLDFFIAQALIIMTIFQVPIVIIGGILLGVFKTKALAAKRRIIYLVVIIGLAIITPTSDIFSLAMVVVPCVVIFEVSLIGGKIVESIRKQKQRLLNK